MAVCRYCKCEFNATKHNQKYCSKYCRETQEGLNRAQKWAASSPKVVTEKQKQAIKGRLIRKEYTFFLKKFGACRG